MSDEAETDADARLRRDRALEHVRQWGDPVLTARARPIETFDAALEREVEAMAILMKEAVGIGLAATQVGTMHRVLVYAVDGGAGPVRALVNPVVTWASRETEVAEEGCLSLPGVGVDVDRPVHVAVEARDARGEPVRVEASGLEARVIQHEVDHLDGVLILERAPRDQRKQALRELRERREAVAT